jgi:hypothetical protein
MTYSWTSTTDFLTCPRKYQWKHVVGWNREATPSIALLRGQAIHAALAAALVCPPTECNSVAVRTAQEWLDADRLTTEKRLAENPPQFEVNVNGIYMDAWAEASAMLSTYVPLLGIGTDWEVARLPDGTPLVEYQMVGTIDDKPVGGTFDAILRNLHTGRLVMVDWKSRKVFPPAHAMICDGQLPLYAALWNYHCRNNDMPDLIVKEVAMVDLRVKIPSPASISVKKGIPNTGAESYDTTWEHWVRTLPAGIDPEDYRQLMMPKLKSLDYYLRWNYFPVTAMGEVSALLNFGTRIELIEREIYPPVYSAFVCQMCPFNSICGSFGRFNHPSEVPPDHQFVAAGFTKEPDRYQGVEQDE